MSHENGKRRPSGETSGAMNPGEKFDPSVASDSDLSGLTREQFEQWHHWLADSYDVPRPRLGYAVMVRTSNGHYRRRLYLALDSAYRAIERAEARGVEAHAVLIELRQVGELR